MSTVGGGKAVGIRIMSDGRRYSTASVLLAQRDSNQCSIRTVDRSPSNDGLICTSVLTIRVPLNLQTVSEHKTLRAQVETKWKRTDNDSHMLDVAAP